MVTINFGREDGTFYLTRDQAERIAAERRAWLRSR